MKKQEISRFMPKNMFANFRFHLIVHFLTFQPFFEQYAALSAYKYLFILTMK